MLLIAPFVEHNLHNFPMISDLDFAFLTFSAKFGHTFKTVAKHLPTLQRVTDVETTSCVYWVIVSKFIIVAY